MITRRQKALASGNESLFKLLRNKVNRERKRCRKIYYQNKVKELRDTKLRDWWRKIKELCRNNKGRKSNIQSILNPDINYTGKELSDNSLQKMTFLNCVTVTQNMCKGGFLHVILR